MLAAHLSCFAIFSLMGQVKGKVKDTGHVWNKENVLESLFTAVGLSTGISYLIIKGGRMACQILL